MDPLRILVVDDEQKFVEAVVERLRLRDFQVHGATSGQEALESLAREPRDVVLLDVKMPGLGGLQILREVRSRFPELPVVLMMGGPTLGDAEEGMRLGAFDYIPKPMHIDDLVGILRAAAGRKESAPTRKADDS